MTHLDLLHRARAALVWPESVLDKQALLRDLDEAITGAYPKRPKKQCYCGEINCNAHTDMEVGEG